MLRTIKGRMIMKEPKNGEWWMCEVYHHEVPYSQVLYRDHDNWLYKVNHRFNQSGMVKTIKPEYLLTKAI
jgi:hypothetical protein